MITLHESTSASQLVVWLVIFGSIAVLANGVLFGLMWRRAGARSLLYRTLILFDGIYGLACLLVVMMFYGPLTDCNTTTLYNITSQHVASKDAAVITDEMRGTGCTVNGTSLPLDIAAFFVTLSSRVMLWCLMALASLATIFNFKIVFRYEDDNGSTWMIYEQIARRDSLYRTLTNNPLPLGSRSNTELLISPYLLNLVFSFQIPILLASIGGISAAVLGVIRKDSLKKGSGAIHIAVMTTFSLVVSVSANQCVTEPKRLPISQQINVLHCREGCQYLNKSTCFIVEKAAILEALSYLKLNIIYLSTQMSAPMFIYIASGWSKVQPGKDYNPDTYLVPSAVLLALTVTWLYKMLVGKPCRMLAVLPVILWTVLWCLMALASLATIFNFKIVFRYEDDNGSTWMIYEQIARRDSLYRTLTNNPLPLGSRSNTELLISPYLLNLVFSFQIPILLASIGGISAAVLGVIRKDSLKKGSGAIHIAVMTTFSLVMSAPMFIYIASGWSKVQPGKDYNPDTYLVFVYTVLLPLVAAAGRGVTQLSCKTWQKCGSNKQAGITSKETRKVVLGSFQRIRDETSILSGTGDNEI
eukprot:sb/3463311/